MKTAQAELLKVKQITLMEPEPQMEHKKNQPELCRDEVDLNETICPLKQATEEREEENQELCSEAMELNEIIKILMVVAEEKKRKMCTILSEREAELELAKAAIVEAQKELEYMKKQMEAMQGLEDQLAAKSVLIDSLELELKRVNELQSLSEKASSDAIMELNELKLKFEPLERENSDQSGYIEVLETEVKKLKLDLQNAKEGLENTPVVDIEFYDTPQDIQPMEISELEADGEENDSWVKISRKDYEDLVSKAEKAGERQKSHFMELENLKKALAMAMAKTGEFRRRAEQAISRAEVAEKAKAALENNLRQKKEQKARRIQGPIALQEASYHKESTSFRYDETPMITPTLGKVLNIDF
ncbi:hypothetical protein NMG60_11009655 [Bertholletia excelsa]